MSDLEYDDYENIEAGEPTRGENSTIRAIRQAARENAKRAKAAEEEVRLLRAELANQTTLNAKAEIISLYRDAGVPTEFAEDAWNLGHTTVEAATAYGISRGLLKDPDAAASAPVQSGPRQSFVPAGSNTSIASTGVKLSYDEYREMAKLEPGKAQRLWDQGMVKGSEDFMVDSDGAVTAKKVPY